MSKLIAELAPLKLSVQKLEDRIKQLEGSSKMIPDPTPNTQQNPTPQTNKTSNNKNQDDKPLWTNVVKKHRPRNKGRQLEAAKSTFQRPPTEQKQFEILYIPSRHRLPRSDTRKKLRKLGIQTHRLLDIHFPARNVIAILIHEDYGMSLREIFESHHIELLDFDPLDPDHLEDPEYKDLDEDSRQYKTEELHKERLFRALRHVRKHVYLPLANAMLSQGWLTKEELEELDEDLSVIYESTKDDNPILSSPVM
jgi:hypothetical protein